MKTLDFMKVKPTEEYAAYDLITLPFSLSDEKKRKQFKVTVAGPEQLVVAFQQRKQPELQVEVFAPKNREEQKKILEPLYQKQAQVRRTLFHGRDLHATSKKDFPSLDDVLSSLHIAIGLDGLKGNSLETYHIHTSGNLTKGQSHYFYFYDVDECDITLSTHSGDCDLYLWERIWWSWSFAKKSIRWGTLTDHVSDKINSSIFDGDYKIKVYCYDFGDNCVGSYTLDAWAWDN
ncbi:MAG: hypothetical protein JSW06_10375 [Thermoplasmatales archaeon]|nr:MAG: hypothetical protein JSW06_10375 [Thermoplasmatales archaeon]